MLFGFAQKVVKLELIALFLFFYFVADQGQLRTRCLQLIISLVIRAINCNPDKEVTTERSSRLQNPFHLTAPLKLLNMASGQIRGIQEATTQGELRLLWLLAHHKSHKLYHGRGDITIIS